MHNPVQGDGLGASAGGALHDAAIYAPFARADSKWRGHDACQKHFLAPDIKSIFIFY